MERDYMRSIVIYREKLYNEKFHIGRNNIK